MDSNKFKLVKYALMLSWDKDTCHKSCLESYDESNKSSGQCAVTSLIINDYFSGIIQSGYISELEIKHYWNVIDDKIYDLTKSQFEKEIKFTDVKEKTREKILSNDNTKKRYELLKERVSSFIESINNINEQVSKCNKCEELVEKFSGNSIYLGERTDILLIGEAPANNGWRKSGLLWRDINEKFVPSAKVLQKLLDPLEINILDISFVEAITCFPVNRKNLKTTGANCREILNNCIQLLNPQIIIPLGEHPTRILLNTKDKFSEIVGVKRTITIGEDNYNVMPIYHPSPISPKSYKDNVPIFEHIKRELK